MSPTDSNLIPTAEVEVAGSNRRDFLRTLFGAAGLAAIAAIPAGKMLTEDEDVAVFSISQQAGAVPVLDDYDPTQPVDVLVRMQAELRRALQKPMHERRWIMIIDLRKCVGCHACTIACVAENKLPPGVVYRQVVEEEIGTYPNVTRRFIPRPCLHCAEPPCVPVCPVNATYTRADGIVVMDYDRCIGCRYCINACPYNSRYNDFGFSQYDDTPKENEVVLGQGAGLLELLPSFEYGQARTRKREQSPIGNVRKCHFCIHRIEVGELPACTTTCIGRATYFGDANDPDSLVAELVASPNVMRLREELGTKPKVYYLT
jgi:molybdopterin-containing oxidoreductase family iron-sulfur binding subunit